jgi:hypothetical protein
MRTREIIGSKGVGCAKKQLQKRWFSTEILIGPCGVYNTFNVQRHLTSAQTHRVLRAAAMTTWREAVTAA